MAYRDRQVLSPRSDPMKISNNRDRDRDRYLDDCFLLCINRDDNKDLPEIRRLENNLMQDICNKNQIQVQSQSKLYTQDQRGQPNDIYDYNEENIIKSSKPKDLDYVYRRKDNQYDRDSPLVTNRSNYQQDNTIDNCYTHNQYTQPLKFNYRDDYNIMQHSDDELSVYEVYVPTNTLNRLGDKRTTNNMVLIDYEDVSMLRDIRGPSSSYGYSQQNPSSQYNNYPSVNQYPSDLNRIRNEQQQLNNYYNNEANRPPYSPQSGPFLPTNIPMDHSDAINIRRHIYSPSQLPQGLTEGQLVMLLQKGSQYQQTNFGSTIQQTQPFSSQNQAQPTTMSAAAPQSMIMPNTNIEPLKTSPYVVSTPMKMPQVPVQLADHETTNDDKISIADELAKPMSTLNTSSSIKPIRDSETKEENKDKKKDKTSDIKKDKKHDKDSGDHKKDSKKEKSSGKDSKKKKK